MHDVSLDMVRAAFAEEQEDAALLLTLVADGLDEPLRVTTEPGGLYSFAGDEDALERHLFRFFPFTFAWGGAGVDEPVRDAQLEIGNTDGVIAEAIRTATGVPRVSVVAVRVAYPDAVERAMTDAPLVDASLNEERANATIRPRNFADEPAVAPRYTLRRTPSLA